MNRAGAATERLMLAQSVERPEDRGSGDRARCRDPRQGTERLIEILDSAQAAARLAHPMTHPGEDPLLASAPELEVEEDAPALFADRNRNDLIGGVDDPLGEGKADTEILQVRGRRHHHRIADAEEADRHRRFGGDDALARPGGIRRKPHRPHKPHRLHRHDRGLGGCRERGKTAGDSRLLTSTRQW